MRCERTVSSGVPSPRSLTASIRRKRRSTSALSFTTVRSLSPTTSEAKPSLMAASTRARASSAGISRQSITLPPTVQQAPLAVMYPSMRCSIRPRLFISLTGLPVEMNTMAPRLLASASASTADCGMLWVLKATSVPSMSKNNAFVMIYRLFFLQNYVIYLLKRL